MVWYKDVTGLSLPKGIIGASPLSALPSATGVGEEVQTTGYNLRHIVCVCEKPMGGIDRF